jgi:hypothetical protein
MICETYPVENKDKRVDSKRCLRIKFILFPKLQQNLDQYLFLIKDEITILVLNQSPISTVFSIVWLPEDQITALTGESL